VSSENEQGEDYITFPCSRYADDKAINGELAERNEEGWEKEFIPGSGVVHLEHYERGERIENFGEDVIAMAGSCGHECKSECDGRESDSDERADEWFEKRI